MHQVNKGERALTAAEAAFVDGPAHRPLDVLTKAQKNHIKQKYKLYLLNHCHIINFDDGRFYYLNAVQTQNKNRG